MAKIQNLNIEYGPNEDSNIVSTFMGIAVKNGDSWRIYDKKKKEITDIGDIQLGNLPIFIFPTTKLEEGDLIKDDGEYYFVLETNANSTQTLNARTGEMKNVIPIKNVLGYSCYSKLIAIDLNMDDEVDTKKLAMMSMMYGQSGKDANQNDSMNNLMPLLLFKDKLGGDDDMAKMLMMSAMMSAPADGGNQNASMNNLMPLFLLKDDLGDDDDMAKMLMMSAMMSGNAADSNNMLMGYFMLNDSKKKKPDDSKKENPNDSKKEKESDF